MRRKISLILIIFSLFCSLSSTYAYYTASSNFIDVFKTEEYVFKISGGGGTFSSGSNVVVDNKSITLPKPSRNGYTFLGYGKTNNNTVDYSNVINDVYEINDKVIYAKWKTNTYNISYNLNGGSISNQRTSYTIEDTFTLPTPYRNGYNFEGWTGTGLNGTTKNVTVKGEVGNRSYTANWRATTYSISYNLNGGSISNQKTSYTIENTFTLPNPTRYGYEFVGWTGTGLNGATKNVRISGGVGNRSYTANWRATTYSISYNLNGGNISNHKTSYTIEDSFTLPTPYRTGYNFEGWTGTALGGATNNVYVGKGNTGNRSYTANWRKYNAIDYGGITLISIRDGSTWSFNLDGHYNPGDTNVHSGNWIVTVDAYCAYITGTQYITRDRIYEFWVYKGNSTNYTDLLGYASDRPGIGNNSKATICW